MVELKAGLALARHPFVAGDRGAAVEHHQVRGVQQHPDLPPDQPGRHRVAVIAAEGGPTSLAISPDGRFLYVGEFKRGERIDLADPAQRVELFTSGGVPPSDLALTPDGGRLLGYFTNMTAELIAVDIGNLAFTKISLAGASGRFVISPAGDRAYIVDLQERAGVIRVIDTGVG